ncbi:MAG: TMEM165/GDT1 family protein [Steroidobacteraceae bacterium]
MTDPLQALLVSTGGVALAEVGDKTQLLALALAARYRRPLPIILGILVATLANHALAGWLGAWLSGLLEPGTLRWILGLSFVAVGAWLLVPDRLDGEEPERAARTAAGVFAATLAAFFVVEIGDKTQVATVILAARYESLLAVVAGTTLGMMLANVPAVLLGEVAARKLPIRLVHGIAATVFVLVGLAILAGLGSGLVISPSP